MPVPSKKDALLAIDAISKLGEFLIDIGKLESSVGPLKGFTKKASKLDTQKIVSVLEKKPEIGAKIGAIFVKTMSIYSIFNKPISEMSPKEKIRVGKTMREISELYSEMVET